MKIRITLFLIFLLISTCCAQVFKKDGVVASDTSLMKPLQQKPSISNSPRMISNVNPYTSMQPYYPFKHNNKLYIINKINGEYRLLHYSDKKGGVLIQNLPSKNSNSWYSYPWNHNKKLYFWGSNGVDGLELWTYDPKERKASILQSIGLKSTLKGVGYKNAIFNNKVNFTVELNEGALLYSYDFSKNCFEKISDFNVSNELLIINSEICFYSKNSAGYDIWVYDAKLKHLIKTAVLESKKDINLGSLIIDERIYFYSTNSTEFNLWVYNTKCRKIEKHSVLQSERGHFAEQLTAYNGILYFSFDCKIWKYSYEKNIFEIAVNTASNSCGSPDNLLVHDNVLYFSGNDDIHGTELWSYNATTDDLKMLTDAFPENSKKFSFSGPFYYIFYMKVIDEKIYFSANDGKHRYQMWCYSLDSGSLRMLTSIGLKQFSESFPFGPAVQYKKNEIFFSADSGIWSYNIATKKTNKLPNRVKMKSSSDGSNPSKIIGYKNNLYFTTVTTGRFRTIIKYDEIKKEVGYLKHLENYIGTTYFIFCMTEFSDSIYFTTYDLKNKHRLFKYDLVNEKVKFIGYISTNNQDEKFFVVYKNKIYFTSADQKRMQQIWSYDPLKDKLKMVTDIQAESKHISISDLIVYNDKLYFTATEIEKGNELWRYDYKTDKAEMVFNLEPDKIGLSPTNLAVYKDKLYFSANDQIKGRELWRYDEYSKEIKMVSDIYVGEEGSFPSNLTVYNDSLYFVADDGKSGNEIWRYNEKFNKTELVSDIYDNNPTKNRSPISNLTVYNDKLFFTADDGKHGNELWQFSKSMKSPVILSDILKGKKSSNPNNLTVHNGKIYFSAQDESHGYELFVYEEK